MINGQVNFYDVNCCQVDFKIGNKEYKFCIDKKFFILIVCFCGWYLEEKYVIVDGEFMFGFFFDFGLYFFYNVFQIVKMGFGFYFYFFKMEFYFEVCFWNDVFNFVQDYIGMFRGIICGIVFIEIIFVVFEMDEIIYEFCDYFFGLNCGRWDYIFFVIKKFC